MGVKASKSIYADWYQFFGNILIHFDINLGRPSLFVGINDRQEIDSMDANDVRIVDEKTSEREAAQVTRSLKAF